MLAVMVRYQMPLHSSATLRSLHRCFAAHPHLHDSVRLVLWDNSPQPLLDPALPFAAEYRHSGRNLGVSGAYNQAAAMARDLGAPWLLLLDQDTELPESFLATMLAHARLMASREQVAAIAPVVRSGARFVSPMRSVFQGHVVCTGHTGVLAGDAFAINSGAVLRVRALQQIGGFSPDFWLDYSDRYVFHQFFLHGWKLWCAADAVLQHEMTILDYDRLMAPWRYKNFIEAEGAFLDLYKGALENAVQNLRLAVRALRQRLRYRNKEFSRITVRYLGARLRSPRRSRVQAWQQQQRSRS
jgi:GT2 family glycosyltransferase